MSRHTISLLFIITLSIIGLFPILSMVSSTFYTHDGISLSGYTKLFYNNALWHSFNNSLILALMVALISTLLGTVIGLLLSKTTLYGRIFWLALLLIPLLLPPYILAYGWYTLLGRESTLGHLLFGFGGTSFILFCIYLPIPILITSLFIRQSNPRLEEAGLLMGSWYTVLKHITLPLLRPAMILSFLLVFILTIGESSVANFLRYDIFPMESFIQFSAFYDFKTATVYTMPLILIVFVVLFIEHAFLGKKSLTLKIQSKQHFLALHSWHFPLLLGMVVFVSVTVLLPLFGLVVHTSMQDFIATLNTTLPSLKRSILYASMGATLLLFFGLFSAYIIVYKTSKLWKYLDTMILFFFILSSIIIGIALILFWNKPSTNIIYTTPIIILFGYLIKYLLLSTKILELKLSQIPHSFIESAQLLGASWYQILYTILIPLLKESLIMAWVIGFIFSLRESTITMLVAPAGSSTLPTYILTQMANGKTGTIAALCLLMIGTLLIPLAGLLLYLYHKRNVHD